MAGDRFFCATILGGQLYFTGLSDWDAWDPTKFLWRTDAEIDALSSTEIRVRSVAEILARLRVRSDPDSAPRTWIHESLEPEVRRYWDFKRTTVEAFGLNMARFTNVRKRLLTAHTGEEISLRQTIDRMRANVEAVRDQIRTQTPLPQLATPIESALSQIAFLDRRLESLGGEAALSREMAFVYLIAIFDAFVGHWRVDLELDRSGHLADATPETIRDTCAALGMSVCFPNDFDRTLGELRARRDVLVHRGGLAGKRYCEVAGSPQCMGQRLEVTDDYLLDAERFITSLVWDELVPNTSSLASSNIV